MWLITRTGFYSIVCKPDDVGPGTLTVRSRVRSDLASLKASLLPALGPIEESRDTDYRFRAKAPRRAVADALAVSVMELSYSNFKDEVAKRQGPGRAQLYHDVWGVLGRMQGNPKYEATKT